MKIAKKVRYSAGRHSAIHGLEHVLQQLTDDKAKQKEVISLLKDIAKTDRSEDVRISTRVVIESHIK